MLPPRTPNLDLSASAAYTPPTPRHGPMDDPDFAQLRARAMKRDPKPRVALCSSTAPAPISRRYVTPTNIPQPPSQPVRSTAITPSPAFSNFSFNPNNQPGKLEVAVVPLTPHRTPVQRKSKLLPHPTGTRFLSPGESPRMIRDLASSSHKEREEAMLDNNKVGSTSEDSSPEGLGPSLIVPAPIGTSVESTDSGKCSNLFSSSSLLPSVSSSSCMSPLNWSERERAPKSFEIFQDSPESQRLVSESVDALKSPVRLAMSSSSSPLSNSPVLGSKSVNSPRSNRNQQQLRTARGPPPPALQEHQRQVQLPQVELFDPDTASGMWFSFRGKRVFRPFVNSSNGMASNNFPAITADNSSGTALDESLVVIDTLAIPMTSAVSNPSRIAPTNAALVPPRRLFGSQSSGSLSLSSAMGFTTLSSTRQRAPTTLDPFISPSGPSSSSFTSSPSPPTSLSLPRGGRRLLTPPTYTHLQGRSPSQVLGGQSSSESPISRQNGTLIQSRSPGQIMLSPASVSSTRQTPTRTPTRGEGAGKIESSKGTLSYTPAHTPTRVPRSTGISFESTVPTSSNSGLTGPIRTLATQSSHTTIKPIKWTHIVDNDGDDNGDDDGGTYNAEDKPLRGMNSNENESNKSSIIAPPLPRPKIRPLLSPLVLTSTEELSNASSSHGGLNSSSFVNNSGFSFASSSLLTSRRGGTRKAFR
ncbi:hypothetical protein NADFUDRAFT_39511 [Nadsonia fulvescens var. elongata DSM 6958]|uniref:Uncharacterized protein n=1 Tax=Nadsonia fulvescens var. elongata DSM 6958 TaxID=857566 RepID=A0A1E3PT55_9ASCO|nr:hypothetical protein NADFUDRAFT_39511 [Nadsonia fulvescens var. elongata DSM 6958]